MGSRLVDPAKLLMRKDSSDPDVGVIAPFDQFVPSFTGKLQVVLHNATGTRIFVRQYLTHWILPQRRLEQSLNEISISSLRMLMAVCPTFFVLTDLKIPEPPGGIPKLKTLSTYCVVQIDDVAVAETPVQKDTLAPKWEKDVTTMLRRSQLIEIIVMHKVSSGPARTGRLSSAFSRCPQVNFPLQDCAPLPISVPCPFSSIFFLGFSCR
jgi:hypothetical protein